MLSWGFVGTSCGPSHQPSEWSPKYLLPCKQPWYQVSWAKQPTGRAVRGTRGPSGLSRGYKFSGKSRDGHHRNLAVTKPQHSLQKTVYFISNATGEP